MCLLRLFRETELIHCIFIGESLYLLTASPRCDSSMVSVNKLESQGVQQQLSTTSESLRAKRPWCFPYIQQPETLSLPPLPGASCTSLIAKEPRVLIAGAETRSNTSSWWKKVGECTGRSSYFSFAMAKYLTKQTKGEKSLFWRMLGGTVFHGVEGMPAGNGAVSQEAERWIQ